MAGAAPAVSHDVRVLGSRDEADYARFVAQAAPGNVYASLEFRDFLLNAAGGDACYLLARRGDGSVAGVLPLIAREVAGVGSVLNSLPWYGSHGGCVLAPGLSDAGTVRDALLGALRRHFVDCHSLAATIVLTPAEQPHAAQYRAACGGEIGDARIGQVTPLPAPGPDLEIRLEGTLRQKTRNLARKSRKQGFTEWCGDAAWAWDFLHTTHVKNMQAMGGRAKPREHFDALRGAFAPRHLRLSVALDGDEPVAAMLLLLWGATIEYLTPVVRVKHRPRQPLSFLIWNAMSELAARGFRDWNWGGTWAEQRSLHHFKAGWGAEDRPYEYVLLARSDAVARLHPLRDRLTELFPYFYVFPYARLGDDGN